MRSPVPEFGREALRVRISELDTSQSWHYSGSLAGINCFRLQDVLLQPSEGISFDADLRREGETVNFNGLIRGTMSLQCDSCLEQVDLNQDENFEIVLNPQEAEPEPAEEPLLSLAELQDDFYEGEWLDLADVLEEQALLSIPAKVLCDTDCSSLCPDCAVNLNRECFTCSQETSGNLFGMIKEVEPLLDNPQT